LEKGLIKIMGRKDLPGRPIIYGTSKAFLELFGLNTLSDLPALKEIQAPPMPEDIRKEEVLTGQREDTMPKEVHSVNEEER
jgi:segregation and condensation protein B